MHVVSPPTAGDRWGQARHLFGEVDRLRAEDELRFAVVPPLVALILALSFVHTWWWLIGLIPIGFLLRQGFIRADESRRGIFEAIAQKHIVSTRDSPQIE